MLLVGCGQQADMAPNPSVVAASSDSTAPDTAGFASNPLRNAYFGDLHIHTANSMDAYFFNVRTTADDAYRYAKGEAIQHAAGYSIRLRGGPLDFYGVSDHSEFPGVLTTMADPDEPLDQHPLGEQFRSSDPQERMAAFGALRAARRSGNSIPTSTFWVDGFHTPIVR